MRCGGDPHTYLMAKSDSSVQSEVQSLQQILKSCLDAEYSTFDKVLTEESLREISAGLLAAKLISKSANDHNAINEDLKSTISSLETLEKLEEFCFNLITVMTGVSEAIKKAAKQLEASFLKVVQEKLPGVTLNIRKKLKNSIQDTESQPNSTSAHQRPMPPKKWPLYSHTLGRTLRDFPEIKQELGEGIRSSLPHSKPTHLIYNEIVSKTYYNRQESEITQDYQRSLCGLIALIVVYHQCQIQSQCHHMQEIFHQCFMIDATQ